MNTEDVRSCKGGATVGVLKICQVPTFEIISDKLNMVSATKNFSYKEMMIIQLIILITISM
jgi:hypothetical protein